MTDRPVTLRLRPFAPTLVVQARHFNRVSERPLEPVWRAPAARWTLPKEPWFVRDLNWGYRVLPRIMQGRTMRARGEERLTPAASAPQSIEDKRACQGSIRPTPTWYGPCDVCPFVDSCNPCATHGCKEDLYRQMAQER